MNSHYETLLSVHFRHEYFADKKLKSLTVTPAKDTQHHFLKNGLLFKSFQHGFTIAYDINFAGRERMRSDIVKDELRLRFILMNNDHHFLNYTSEFEADLSDRFFYFSNTESRGISAVGVLHKQSFVSIDELAYTHDFKDLFFSKPFGIVDIILHEDMGDNYVIGFNTKSTHWRYMVTSNYLSGLPLLAVVNTNTKKFFNGPERITLPDNKSALVFSSDAEIPLSEVADRSYQLIQFSDENREKYKIIKSILPNPDIHVISKGYTALRPVKESFSEIFI